MQRFLCVALVALMVAVTQAEIKKPTVNIYTENPVEFGVKNKLICHCSGFHPPRIEMTLKKDDVKYEKCIDSDLSFKQDWTYHKMTHVDFIPQQGEKYECIVKHDEANPLTYRLEIF